MNETRPPGILIRFGQVIRAMRVALDMTQEEMAEKAGLHRTYIADIERGTRNVSLRNVEKLACALEISLETLFASIERGPK